MNSQKSVLCIGPHLDDCEDGVGGICLKLARQGYRIVFFNTISEGPAWATIGTEERQKQFRKEAIEAANILSAEKIIWEYKGNRLLECDIGLREEIRKVIKEVGPEYAFIHWPRDNHYDHARLSRVAFELLAGVREIYAYEAGIWQTVSFEPDFYVDITEEIDTVIKAERAFRVMDGAQGSVMKGTVLEELVMQKKAKALYRGFQSGFNYAEALIYLGPLAPLELQLPKLLGKECIRPAGQVYPWGMRYFR